jgi:hypothetical protein
MPLSFRFQKILLKMTQPKAPENKSCAKKAPQSGPKTRRFEWEISGRHSLGQRSGLRASKKNDLRIKWVKIRPLHSCHIHKDL